MILALIAILGLGSLVERPSDGPARLKIDLERARPGTTIKLAPGDYGRVVIVDRHWSPAITIDAGRSILGVTILRSSGIAFRNGVFGDSSVPGINGRAASITMSRDISFDGSLFRNARVGAGIDQSSSIRISRAEFRGMSADGVDIASSHEVVIESVRCHDFVPSDRHPDCVQMWSRPGKVTADITIRNNIAEGAMQGFTGFNHVRQGVDDGGFDRVRLTGNMVRSTAPNGVTLSDCRDCVIADNVTDRLPNARFPVKTRTPRCSRCEIRSNRDSD